MPTKLKELEVISVDFVDAGANKNAFVQLFKRKDPPAGAASQEEQEQYKKALDSYTKALGLGAVKKEAVSTDEMLAMEQRAMIDNEIYRVCGALRDSLGSILYDDEAQNKLDLMQESLSQFVDVCNELLPQWAKAKTGLVTKNVDQESKDPNDINKQKGETTDMKFDKSKMTPDELATFEELEKKYALPEDEPTVEKSAKVDPEGNEEEFKEEKPEETKKAADPAESDADDVYKGMHPAVRAELDELKKFKEETEMRELREVAKKYELLGKKTDELATTLKSLKAAGGSAYDDMLSILDASLEVAKSSGAFQEIGKSGHGQYAGSSVVAKSDAEAKIESIAKTYMEEDPSMTRVDALAKAWTNNPDLYADYESEVGFN